MGNNSSGYDHKQQCICCVLNSTFFATGQAYVGLKSLPNYILAFDPDTAIKVSDNVRSLYGLQPLMPSRNSCIHLKPFSLISTIKGRDDIAHVNTVDRKYFVLKIFRAQKIVVFDFRGWSQPQKLNTDHTLYVTLCTSTVGTATMVTLGSLERERRDKLILLDMVLQSHPLHQLLNVDRIVTEGCGQIDTNDQSTSFIINYHLVGDRHRRRFRKRELQI